MTGDINSRSVIKNGQERQARGVMDSDAFILPDYTSSSPARSHQVHTSGTKRARTPLGGKLSFFCFGFKPAEWLACVRLFISFFFYSGGLCTMCHVEFLHFVL